jgi:CheY-like chemotaxis protein
MVDIGMSKLLAQLGQEVKVVENGQEAVTKS